jgi:ABC-2 type transport system ATP-binding protein
MESLLTVRETLEMYAGYYSSSRPVGDTIELVGLAEKADERAGRLSGGQQRRLDVAVALIGDAELLVLDEPTTGFDPSARRRAWDLVQGLRDLGATILLTTHYLDEAEHLADRVGVLVRGKLVAEGTPAELMAAAPEATISFELPGGVDAAQLAVPADATVEAGRVTIATEMPTAVLAAITAAAVDRGVELAALSVRRPSLEEVFLKIGEESS